MERRIGSFDTFLAGALLFLAGVGFTHMLHRRPGHLSGEDLATLATVTLLAIRGAFTLRLLHRAQGTAESAARRV